MIRSIGDQFVATTLFGLEDVLAGELQEQGAENIRPFHRAVRFSGSPALMYKLNLTLRTAIRILVNIKSFTARNEEDFYDQVTAIDWNGYFPPSRSITVNSAVNSKYFSHSHYIALKAKDAIVDKFRKQTGKRPDVDVNNPDISIHVHINDFRVDISLDSSGEPLFKRGYRTSQFIAPLNEALAAGMILMSGWRGESDFIDPMCGSGTLPIEAAMIALNVPPGILRSSFAFMNWNDYDEDLYTHIVESLLVSKPFHHKIRGYDISAEAVTLARDNAAKALLGDMIEIERADFMEVRAPGEEGLIMMNPPYGERIREERIVDFYKSIGNRLKQEFAGYTAWILSANTEALKYVGLKPTVKKELLNGSLKCKFLKYDMFKGKRKDQFGNGQFNIT